MTAKEIRTEVLLDEAIARLKFLGEQNFKLRRQLDLMGSLLRKDLRRNHTVYVDFGEN